MFRLRHSSLLLGSLISALFALITATPIWANEGNEPALIPGTIFNFMDYFKESLEDIQAHGGESVISFPQQEYGRGPGPIAVLPEIIGSVLSGPQFSPFFIFDVPTLPFELRLNISTPEIPAINRTVVGITEQGGFTKPHIPPLRWSADGRLGVESQVGGSLADPSSVKLYLLTPENLDVPFVESAPGPQTLVLDKVELPFEKLAQGRSGSIQHTNICDPFVKDPGTPNNPYSCGVGGEDDCYDVTLISAYVRLSNEVNGDQTPAKLDKWDRLMGTPLHIRVSQPKTPTARIEEVSYGETIFAPKRHGVLFETITPADGRFVLARRGFMPLVWRNTQSNKTHVGSYDIVYSVSPEDADPCDVSHWGDMYPITHAPYDERVNSRYAFAKLPFRDPSGKLIPDGVDIKGTYPWMDKEAKMFSMQVSPAKLFPTYSYDKKPKSRYPVRCVLDEACDYDNLNDTDNSKDNLFALVGAWTHGKIVLLDGLLNDIDFRLGGRDKDHSFLSLYQAGTGHKPGDSGEVRVGSTRGASLPYPVRNAAGELLGHYQPENFSMFDSIENRLNYLENLKPSTFNDVVWNMSSGHSTAELAFDDYLNPDGFIVSNMVAHLQHQNYDWYKMYYFDGWHQLSKTFNGQVRIQNSATALPERWHIPEYGRVYNGRMEPVANGGIRGKGLWLNGRNTRIEYAVPEQPQDILRTDWFYGFFIDPRYENQDDERVLIQFPDRSNITLKGLNEIVLYNSTNKIIASVALPEDLAQMTWTHIGLVVHALSSEEHQIELLVNGFPLQNLQGSLLNSAIEPNNFRPSIGKLVVGNDTSWGRKKPFRGWIDEFKVFAYRPNFESLCNFAHGTLIGLPNEYEGPWKNKADLYAPMSHESLTIELAGYGEQTYPRYACFHDYSNDDKAHLKNIPSEVASLRESLNFPEGPLFHDAPRPDSAHNSFCLSCHHVNGKDGLSIRALTLNPHIAAKDDRRRQPTQPPSKVFGNIPAGWLPNSPDTSVNADVAGVKVDEWILPSSEGVAAQIKNLALAESSGEPWRALVDNERLQKTSLPLNITQIRANVNGLVRYVIFEMNGEVIADDQTPFTLDLESLTEQENNIEVTAYLENGAASEKYRLTLYLLNSEVVQ